MPDIKTVESAILGGMARVEDWMSDWQAEFYRPVGEAMMRALFSSMTPQQRQMLRQQNPDAYDDVARQIGWKESKRG